MNSNDLINAEDAYRRQQVSRGLAASRKGRSRSSWVRRIASVDPTLTRTDR